MKGVKELLLIRTYAVCNMEQVYKWQFFVHNENEGNRNCKERDGDKGKRSDG